MGGYQPGHSRFRKRQFPKSDTEMSGASPTSVVSSEDEQLSDVDIADLFGEEKDRAIAKHVRIAPAEILCVSVGFIPVYYFIGLTME